MGRLFGTNGIRGIVNQGIDPRFCIEIGSAIGTYFKKRNSLPKIAIGTDARLSNSMLKSAVASGLLSTGCNVTDIGVVPSPVVQYTVKKKGFHAGVIITASHNPPEFNGIKVIAGDGTELPKEIEDKIETIYFNKDIVLADWQEVGIYDQYDDAIDFYKQSLISVIDIDLIKRKKFRVVLDCGGGAGCVIAPKLLSDLGCDVTCLFCKLDGTFSGRNSEPLKENLTELIKMVPQIKADFGVALDGDADRAIFVDENGRYLPGDKTLALVAKYLTKINKGGITVTPVTSSSCVNDVVTKFGGTVIQTAVGSPIVARVMMENKALFGGEENGGLIFPDFQYCRDSIMSILKIMEIIATGEKSLSELIYEIPNYDMFKTKVACPNNIKEFVLKQMQENIGEKTPIKIDKTDGLKMYFKEGWVLVRPSGTEPIFRIFAESDNTKKAENLGFDFIEKIEKIVTQNKN
ncbi:MAG: phosphoglucosamine mutase [Candidatus Thermoplasmatota archaeon]|nr:phosphoglucosamine mutase [Candidatus Thermoplasmatota archaeon]